MFRRHSIASDPLSVGGRSIAWVRISAKGQNISMSKIFIHMIEWAGHLTQPTFV